MRSSIAGLIFRRCLTIPPVLLGISILTFFVINVLPGDAAQQLLGAEATPEQVAQLKVVRGTRPDIHHRLPAGNR